MILKLQIFRCKLIIPKRLNKRICEMCEEISKNKDDTKVVYTTLDIFFHVMILAVKLNLKTKC